jgi:hypothetical protein
MAHKQPRHFVSDAFAQARLMDVYTAAQAWLEVAKPLYKLPEKTKEMRLTECKSEFLFRVRPLHDFSNDTLLVGSAAQYRLYPATIWTGVVPLQPARKKPEAK